MTTEGDGGKTRLSERLYTVLLGVYPREVRDEREAEYLGMFRYRRDHWVTTRGGLGVSFWMFILRDALVSALRERREPLDASGRPSPGSTRGGDGMMGWFDDLRYAGRRLRRSPGFTLTALTILLLGIGVNSTAFSVVDALLLSPPPFEDPERVVTVLQDSDGGEPSSTSYPAYLDITRTPGVFSSVSAFFNDQTFLEQGDQLTPILAEFATASYMEVIGLSPSRGIWFQPEHDDPSGSAVAVITYGMWRDRFASDPDILGRSLRIEGASVTVIGVGPPEFNGGLGPAAVDLWLSISALGPTGGRVASLTRRQDHPLTVRARLAPSVTIEQATAAMDRLASELERTYPEINTNRGIAVLSVLSTRISPEADARILPAAVLALVVSALVLIIGTLNLANLLLVRSTARAREMAVRVALGAGRTRVMRVVMGEALILAALGGAGGLAMAALVARLLRSSRFDTMVPILIDLRLDARVVAFTALLSLLTAALFGLLPSIRATRRDVNATLRDDASEALGSRRRIGLTGVLVAGQVAVSLLLLSVAGAFVESLLRAQGADPGFDWERTAYVTINAAPLEMDDEGTLLMFEQLEERFETLPGTGQASTSLMLPGAQFGTTTLLLGAGASGVDAPTEIPWNYVSPDYFDVLGIPLLHGRLLTDADADRDVAVVSESFARTYWGRSDVAGETYRSEGDPEILREIIGVVADATVRSLGEPPTPSIYWPISFVSARMNFLLEVDEAAPETLAAVRSIVREVDPRLMILESGSMSDHLGDTLDRQRLAGGLLGGLGAAALLLAMLGIYGVVSFAVSRRSHEVGIRIALGARSESVVGLFVREVSGVVLVGAVIGAAISVPVARLVGQLFPGATASPVTIGTVTGLLLVTSLLATILPALGAVRVNPTEALRRD